MRYELVEINPDTWEEDQLHEVGSLAKVTRTMNDFIENQQEQYDLGVYPWVCYRIQPAE